MNARRLIAMMTLAAVVATAAGCGGGGTSPGAEAVAVAAPPRAGSCGSGRPLHRLPEPVCGHRVPGLQRLRHDYPQLVQYGPGEKLEGDWATSWSHSSDGLTGRSTSSRRQVVRRQAAHGRGRRLDGQHYRQIRGRADGGAAAALTHVTKMAAPNPTRS